MSLIHALKLLASSKERQINYLDKLGTSPSTDELALQFDDAYKFFLGTLNESEKSSYGGEVLKLLDSINSILNEMSNETKKNFWVISSLDGISWNEVRKIAEKTLQLMGEDFEL